MSEIAGEMLWDGPNLCQASHCHIPGQEKKAHPGFQGGGSSEIVSEVDSASRKSRSG
jgi:hypothetical protein